MWGHEENYTAKVRKPPTPKPELFSLVEECGGGLPAPLPEVAAWQERVQRHATEHLAVFASLAESLDAPVPQVADNVMKAGQCTGIGPCKLFSVTACCTDHCGVAIHTHQVVSQQQQQQQPQRPRPRSRSRSHTTHHTPHTTHHTPHTTHHDPTTPQPQPHHNNTTTTPQQHHNHTTTTTIWGAVLLCLFPVLCKLFSVLNSLLLHGRRTGLVNKVLTIFMLLGLLVDCWIRTA